VNADGQEDFELLRHAGVDSLEGLGTTDKPYPIQRAFIDAQGVRPVRAKPREPLLDADVRIGEHGRFVVAHGASKIAAQFGELAEAPLARAPIRAFEPGHRKAGVLERRAE
jgi:hypothetical protein